MEENDSISLVTFDTKSLEDGVFGNQIYEFAKFQIQHFDFSFPDERILKFRKKNSEWTNCP